jgi:Protein of unknown function (DUF1329)
MSFKHQILALCLLAVSHPLVVFADATPDPSSFTFAEFEQWFKTHQDAAPQFLDGDVLGIADRDRLDPFLPPGLVMADFYYDGIQIKIKDAGDLSPPQHFLEATEKFKGQATIDANGAIQNYTAGTPFDRTQFKPGSAEDGFRAMWNYNFRWMHYGLALEENDWVWAERGGEHRSHMLMSDPKKAKYYGGGGRFDRVLNLRYQRVNCSNLTMLADTGYRFADRWCDGIEWRELSDFYSPFDIAGTAFVVFRYSDPYKPDDAWAYIPSLRRVRRISVEVKSDSLLGTEDTLEDFYGFAGRIMEWKWEYMGRKKILAIARSRNAYPYYDGPNGTTQIDDWALREVDVVKGTPIRSDHPYSIKVIMFDSQNNIPYYSEAYDRAGKIWKVWRIPAVWTDDPHFEAGNPTPHPHPTPPGTRMSAFQGIDVFNLQNGRSTLIPSRRGVGYPAVDLPTVKRKLSVNYLTQGR